jgi:hypothetical protein
MFCISLEYYDVVFVINGMESTDTQDAFASRFVLSVSTFVGVLVVMLILCTNVWGQFVTDRLYNCTDAVGFDFLQPGNWVHGHIEYVEKIAPRSMSEPDSIKMGWSNVGLWTLWYSMFGASLIISILPAVKVWNAIGRCSPDPR